MCRDVPIEHPVPIVALAHELPAAIADSELAEQPFLNGHSPRHHKRRARAARLGLLNPPLAAPNILPLCHRFEMVRPHTSMIAAEMVDHHIFRDRPNEELVGQPMNAGG
jgi:hypothetical protein